MANLNTKQYKQMAETFAHEKRILSDLPVSTTFMFLKENQKLKSDTRYVGPFMVLHRTRTDRMGINLPHA